MNAKSLIYFEREEKKSPKNADKKDTEKHNKFINYTIVHFDKSDVCSAAGQIIST